MSFKKFLKATVISEIAIISFAVSVISVIVILLVAGYLANNSHLANLCRFLTFVWPITLLTSIILSGLALIVNIREQSLTRSFKSFCWFCIIFGSFYLLLHLFLFLSPLVIRKS